MASRPLPPLPGPLRGTRVLVAGAGVAGLVCARRLAARGAAVHVVEARERLGGRILTIRREEPGRVHVEAGGEFIDAEHRRVRALARELGLRLAPVLRAGFGTAIRYGGRTHVMASQTAGWRELRRALDGAVGALEESRGDWRGTAAAAIAGRSLLDLLREAGANSRTIAFAQALRGFFAADASQISALVAVGQLLEGNPGAVRMSRVAGGADRIVSKLEEEARFTIERRRVLRRLRHTTTGVRATIEQPDGRLATFAAHYCVLTLPPPLLRRVEFSPDLPHANRRAFETLTMGTGTKVLLGFASPWWRRTGRPNAFGTNLPVGAVWEATNNQARGAVLTLFAGGSASADVQALVKARGASALLAHLRWLGRPQPALWHDQVVWERDPWARGAYAVVTPSFDPYGRDVLGRASGRVLFAGEHTSREAQGYIEGAVESGERAAADVESLVRIGA